MTAQTLHTTQWRPGQKKCKHAVCLTTGWIRLDGLLRSGSGLRGKRAKLTGILMHVTKKVTTIQVTTTRVTTTRVFYAGTTTVIDTTTNYDDMLSNRALCFSQRNEL